MLASIINQDEDIEIFLTEQEIEKLEITSLHGQIFEFQNKERRYPLKISLEKIEEWKKYNQSCNGIGRQLKNKKYFIYISDVTPDNSYYKILKEKGWIGTRYGNIKIDIMKKSFARQDKNFYKDLRAMKLENRE